MSADEVMDPLESDHHLDIYKIHFDWDTINLEDLKEWDTDDDEAEL